MGDTFISDGLTRERISPATQELQREIRNELQKANEAGHHNYETQKIVIDGDKIGKGVKLACKDVQIITDATDLQVTIVDSADTVQDGDDQGWLIPQTTPVSIKVDDVGRLRFYATAAKIVYILIRKVAN